ncbi:U1 SNP1-associating protein 1 [Nakaseomyces bracarensis]|uniref:U1 SNP1-associating protein 1 n=1 Tax=Nakaseomyces bracarensis TaxID=273131 RepID=A0ABR4P0I2_9SACH
MTEFLVGKPWKLRLYRQGETPVNVNVFPETEVARVVQYAHYIFKIASPVDNIDVKYKNIQLPLYKSIKEAIRTSSFANASLDIPSFIKLEIVGETDNLNTGAGAADADEGTNGDGDSDALHYDPMVFSRYMDVDLQINSLSVDKIVTTTVKKIDVRENGVIPGLAKEAVDKLVDYEKIENDGKNPCGLNDTHTTSDLIAFLIKGNHIPFKFLHDLDPHCYDDLSMLDLLGVDLLPTDDTTITIMFNCVHEQKQLENTGSSEGNEDITDDSDKLEFVSDAVLSIKFMNFNSDTTVKDVKNFVCSVYTHTLHLTTNDIKLIYKGRLMENDASKVRDSIEYGSAPNKIYKIHVQINQEFHEPSGPGFWSELFSNPNLFDFVSSSTRLNTPALTPTPTTDNLRAMALHRALSNLHSVTSQDGSHAEPGLEFFTENEEKIQPTSGELYVRCLVGEEGKEVFINSKELSNKEAVLEINGQVFELSEYDYDFDNDDMNVLNLSKNLIDRLQDSLGIEITRNMFTVAHAPTSRSSTPRSFSANSEPSAEPTLNIDQFTRRHRRRREARSRTDRDPNHNTFQRQVVRYFGKFIALALLVFRTIYFVGYNALIPIFILYEFSPIVPSKYSYVVIVLLIARAIWNTHEIWVMWSAYLHLNEVNEEKLMALEEHVDHRKLTRHYFNTVGQKEWKQLEKSIKRIIVEPPELQDIRNQLYEIAEVIKPDEQANDANNGTEVVNDNPQEQPEQINEQPAVIPIEEQLGYLKEIFIRLGNEETEKSVEILEKMYVLLNATIERYKVRRSRLVRNPPLKKMWDDFLILIWKDVKYVNPSPNFLTTVTEKIVRITEFTQRPELFDGVLDKIIPNPDIDNVFIGFFKNVLLFFLLFFPFVKEKTLEILQKRERERSKKRSTETIPAPTQETGDTDEPAIDELNTNTDTLSESSTFQDCSQTSEEAKESEEAREVLDGNGEIRHGNTDVEGDEVIKQENEGNDVQEVQDEAPDEQIEIIPSSSPIDEDNSAEATGLAVHSE